MVSTQALQQFLNKKVFVKIIDDHKVQVGILKKIDEDYFLDSHGCKSLINPEQIARITMENGGAR